MITLGGKAGSGKSTVGKQLVEKLGYEKISIGEMKRQLAHDMGISIQEFNELGDKPENAQEFDRKYDDYQKSLDPMGKYILDSRLSFWCQPKAFKVFLDVDAEESARRIRNDQRETDNYDSIDDLIAVTKARNEKDGARYMNLYGVNPRDLNNYDLVVDTTNIDADGVSRIVEVAYREWQRTNT